VNLIYPSHLVILSGAWSPRKRPSRGVEGYL